MAEESKMVDPTKEQPHVASDDESDSDAEAAADQGTSVAGDKKKKKKSKRNKAKQALAQAMGGGALTEEQVIADPMKAIQGLSHEEINEFMKLNPALANELQARAGSSGDAASTVEAFKQLKLQDIMTGLATSGKNRKDMASYKFWATQPVQQFGEEQPGKLIEEGPLRVQDVKDVPTDPVPLALDQFRWVTVDLTNDEEIAEVEKLLYGHYVEDDEAMFRLKYSKSILKWSLMSPGWKKEWHVGIRSGNTLCAFISAIPMSLRVRDNVLNSSEVNFLCIHKKLRGKRLAPVLIKEVTRRCNLEGVFQAIYTGGIVLPKPVSTARYYHRSLDWQKLYDVGFCQCPSNSKPSFQVRKYKVPENTTTKGLREIQSKDLDAVHSLLERYLKRFDLTPVFDKAESEHWLVNKLDPGPEQVVWSYVVEDANGKITDFFSFYCLESSVIKSPKHSALRAAYLFYYATETGLTTPVDRPALKTRLNELMGDALILAKRHNFDVFNALSIMDNVLFLEDQKFGAGDGQLHYYLFNYKANPIAGGVDAKNRLDEQHLSGVGVAML